MLHALVDRIEATSGTDIVLVAPPPVIANPGLGQAYAVAVKRVGLRRQVAVADAYSAFKAAAARGRMTPGGSRKTQDWREFYRDPDSSVPLYHLAPTARGQALIAEAIADVLLGNPLGRLLGRVGEREESRTAVAGP